MTGWDRERIGSNLEGEMEDKRNIGAGLMGDREKGSITDGQKLGNKGRMLIRHWQVFLLNDFQIWRADHMPRSVFAWSILGCSPWGVTVKFRHQHLTMKAQLHAPGARALCPGPWPSPWAETRRFSMGFPGKAPPRAFYQDDPNSVGQSQSPRP